VAEARQATGKKLKTTALGKVTPEHVKNNPLVAAACEVGVNGVRQDQWVVTSYIYQQSAVRARASASASSTQHSLYTCTV
jgi:hypothetical protein